MKASIRWWRDRRDPFAELEPFELPLPERDEMDTDLRDTLEEIVRADARGGPDEVFRVIEKRYARKRDDARFRRETIQLRIAIATLVVAALAVVATVVGILVTLGTRG